MTTTLAILGCGNMGGALVRGMHGAQLPYAYVCYDPEAEKARALAATVSGTVAATIAELPANDIYLLCCKPQQIGALATELAPHVPTHATIVSILAGTTLATLRTHFPTARHIVRTMPNLPALLGAGVVGICAEAGTTDAVRTQIDAMFAATSRVIPIADEALMNAVTACTGSGPAYVFEFARCVIDATIALGIAPEHARDMVLGLIMGSAQMLAQSSESPETLRDQVTSKGGTTAAALDVLARAEFPRIIAEALAAANQRAIELGT